VENWTVTVSTLSDGAVGTEDTTDTARDVSGIAEIGSLNGTVVVGVLDIWRVKVLPAGMEGFVTTGTGIGVDCFEV
jgi:hypothetical protein